MGKGKDPGPMGPGEQERRERRDVEVGAMEVETGEEGDACRTREGGVEEGTRRRVIEL